MNTIRGIIIKVHTQCSVLDMRKPLSCKKVCPCINNYTTEPITVCGYVSSSKNTFNHSNEKKALQYIHDNYPAVHPYILLNVFHQKHCNSNLYLSYSLSLAVLMPCSNLFRLLDAYTSRQNCHLNSHHI